MIYLSGVHSVSVTHTIYVITALLQSDGVSSPWEHVCDEHALFQWHVRRCLWPLQHHLPS